MLVCVFYKINYVSIAGTTYTYIYTYIHYLPMHQHALFELVIG